MRSRARTGSSGEGVAAAHLAARGYDIIERNVRLPEGEIDIVARDGSTVVLVEVRTRRGDALGDGLDSVDARKATRLRTLAAAYAARHGVASDVRIDVIAIDLAADGRLLGVRHVENAIEDIVD